MTVLAVYLVKVILCSGLLYGYYLLALRNRVFHQWNRFYLLATVVFSLLFPLLPMPALFAQPASPEPFPMYGLLYSEGAETTVDTSGSWHPDWTTAVKIIYAAVGAGFLLRLLLALRSIGAMLERHPAKQIGAVVFVPTAHPAAPFSFFRWLFWRNEIDLESPAGQSIFRHELVHIKEKHSWDKLALQLVLIPFWCNPFFWAIRSELQLIHEFIADKKAVGNAGTEALAAMILQSVYGTGYNDLVNPFFQQPIKRRLAMLQKTLKQPRAAYLGRIISLPLCALLLFAFSEKMHTEKEHLPLARPITVVIDAGHGGADAGATANGTAEKELTLALAKSIRETNSNPDINIVFTRSGDELPELQHRVDVAKNASADLFISLHVNALPEEAIRPGKLPSGIQVKVSGKNEASRNRSMALASALVNHLGKVYPTESAVFTQKYAGIWVLDRNTVPAAIIECGYMNNEQDIAFLTNATNRKKLAGQILQAIEAVAASPAALQRPAIDTIPANIQNADIKEVHVNHSSADTTIRIVMKNGKQVTYTQKEAAAKGLISARAPEKKIDNKVLVVVDGVVKGTIGDIGRIEDLVDQNDIESMNVLKGDQAVGKYGERGAAGVIELLMKQPMPQAPVSRDPNAVFQKVEQEAAFPGGEAEWRKFLGKTLHSGVPVAKGAPAGSYTVIISMVVAADGTISNVKALTQNGYGMEEEVLRMMQGSPNWQPAVQNGHAVASIRKQPITFVIAEE